MKKSLKRIVSLALVMAVLMTSMLVGSVGAAAALDPMQEVLLSALSLSDTNKTAFTLALTVSESKITADIATAANELHRLFPAMSVADATLALEKYNTLAIDQRATIKFGVSVFNLDEKSYDGYGFDSIVDIVNAELGGNAGNNKGTSFIIQVLQKLNSHSEKGAWVTDVSSDTSKIEFAYNSNETYVKLAITQLDSLVGSMETLNAKLLGRTEATTYAKLLGYIANKINTTVPATEITALKTYLNGINDSYYIPYVSSSTSTTTTTPVVTPVTNDETKAVNDLVKTAPSATATGLEANAYEKALDAAISKAIASVGTSTATPTISGTTATVTADQIKVSDILAKADAVIAKAAELEKTTAGMNVTVEKKIVIDVDSKGATKLNVAISSDLLTKVKEKGIQTIEISNGDVKINMAPDFDAGVKDSASIAFGVDKVTVSDELKATMTEEQKLVLASNPTVYDFSAKLVSSTGTETKLTNFDKSIKVKIKYTLKAGENKDSVTVLFLGDDGKIQNMSGRYDATTGEIEFITNHFSTYVVKNVVSSFKDVTTGTWYKTQTESLASKGIVAGVANNNFLPKANITRAQFITMLVKAKGVYDESATCDFKDVNKDAWYYTYVASAIKAGIANGVGDSRFAPNSLITREQMAVMIANALDAKTLDNASSYLAATDASKIAAYAKNGVALCVKNEFIVGSDNKLDPKGNATRGMAAVVIYKYFNYIY